MIKEAPSTTANTPFKPLVNSIKDSTYQPDLELPCGIETAFRIPGSGRLRLNTSNWNREATNFFTARSARDPENLFNHAQRIIHHIQQKNTEGAYGALLDLFIVLKHHGRPLRERMLQYASPLLQEEQYQRLHRLLDNEKWNKLSLPSSNFSILSSGVDGSRPLVEKNFQPSDTRYNRLNESRSYMENGQLIAAKTVLETAVLNGSLETDIHKDLIDLYRRTYDKIGFLKIYPQLQIQQKSLTILWKELNDFFTLD